MMADTDSRIPPFKSLPPFVTERRRLVVASSPWPKMPQRGNKRAMLSYRPIPHTAISCWPPSSSRGGTIISLPRFPRRLHGAFIFGCGMSRNAIAGVPSSGEMNVVNSAQTPSGRAGIAAGGRHLRVEMRWSVLTTKALICLFGHKGALAAWCVPGTRLPADHQPFTWGPNTRSTRAKFALALGSQGKGLLLFDHLVGARSSPAKAYTALAPVRTARRFLSDRATPRRPGWPPSFTRTAPTRSEREPPQRTIR